MIELDNILSDDARKTEIFGSAKVAKQYAYQPVIRTPVVEDTVEDSDESGDEKGGVERNP